MSSNNPGILTSATQNYIQTFSGYYSQFLQWGEWLFFGLLILNFIWLCLWYAFDKNSLTETMPDFIKRFTIATIFFTIMLNAPEWMGSIVKSSIFMGETLIHKPIDPSSILSQGISLANKLILPIEKSSWLSFGFGAVVVLIVWLVVSACFISIALDLALTLIITYACISLSALLLAFSALEATSQIARQCIDVVLGKCFKLLALYLVVATGSQTIMRVANQIPSSFAALDPYWWILSVVLLFWLVAKNLPNQIERIVSNAITEHRGTDAAALAMAAVQYSKLALKAVKAPALAVAEIGKMATSTAFNAKAHWDKAGADLNNNASAPGRIASAIGNAGLDLLKASGGKLKTQFGNIQEKMAGKSGHNQNPSVSERMYGKTKNLQAQTSHFKNTIKTSTSK